MGLGRKRVLNLISEQMELERKKQPLSDALKLLENYHGGIWIVGGFLPQAMVYKMYNRQRGTTDLDIMLQQEYDVHQLPELNGWTRTNIPEGGLRLNNGEMQIDVWSLHETEVLKERNLEKNLNNYFKTVPFNIQAIAYGAYSGMIMGELGIESLGKMLIKVNDNESAENKAKKLGKSVEEIIISKANKLGFGYIY